jgi:hypothetical protein
MKTDSEGESVCVYIDLFLEQYLTEQGQNVLVSRLHCRFEDC